MKIPYFALPFLALPIATVAAELSLENFLQQVEESHQGIKASQLISEGTAERSRDGELLLAPTLFANYTDFIDRKETPTPAFQGTSTKAQTYSFGVSKLTDFGLVGKLSYNLMHMDIAGASLIPVPNYYTASPQLDINFSFLRNGLGSEVKAQQAVLSAASRATSYGEAFKAKVSRIDAENTYWRLVMARKTLAVQKEVITRAQKLVDWAKRRVNMQLGDRSDLLQAEAGLELRRLELKAAQDEIRAASLAFNSARNLDSDSVPEALSNVNADALTGLVAPSRSGTRLDVKAAEEQKRAAEANAQLAREKAKASLDVFGSWAWNGRDAERSAARTESLTSKFPTNSMGLKFSTPLYFGLMKDVFDGTAKEKQGAELNYQRKIYEQEQEWSDLNSRLKEAQNRLALSKEIEAIQKVKHENEQSRLLKGRTTTYQALLFEQDYAQAQLLRIRTQAEILRLYTQLKVFQNEKEVQL